MLLYLFDSNTITVMQLYTLLKRKIKLPHRRTSTLNTSINSLHHFGSFLRGLSVSSVYGGITRCLGNFFRSDSAESNGYLKFAVPVREPVDPRWNAVHHGLGQGKLREPTAPLCRTLSCTIAQSENDYQQFLLRSPLPSVPHGVLPVSSAEAISTTRRDPSILRD